MLNSANNEITSVRSRFFTGLNFSIERTDPMGSRCFSGTGKESPCHRTGERTPLWPRAWQPRKGELRKLTGSGKSAGSVLVGIIVFILSLCGMPGTATAQTTDLSVTLATNIDTTGMDAADVQNLERTVKLSLGLSGSSSDTLIVELGMEAGSYDLLTRRFPLSETGQFADGCSLNITGGGMVVGLGNYTGLSDFYVRAYLASAGVGSAVSAP